MKTGFVIAIVLILAMAWSVQHEYLHAYTCQFFKGNATIDWSSEFGVFHTQCYNLTQEAYYHYADSAIEQDALANTFMIPMWAIICFFILAIYDKKR